MYIFKANDNVNLNCIYGTKKDGVYKSFLENYEKNKSQTYFSFSLKIIDIFAN